MKHKNTFLSEAKQLEPEMKRYMECMIEVKNRWFYLHKSLQKSYSKIEIEHMCLHFRMITESILLANLSSHEGHYYKTLHELAGMWNIHEIIKTISHINPDFYPITITTKKTQVQERPDAGGYIHFSSAALSKDDLINIHSSCSEYLHPQNPFAITKNYTISQNFENWLEKINQLLKFHSIRLSGGGNRHLFVEIDFTSTGDNSDDIKVGYLKQRD
jgi:hypothetical protein